MNPKITWKLDWQTWPRNKFRRIKKNMGVIWNM